MLFHARPNQRANLALAIALAFSASLACGAENPAAELEAPTVEVIGTTPIQGIGVPISQVPANVQTATGADIQKQQSLDLSQYLDNNLGSVTLNHGQNNPFQPDVNFRGVTASPLLGTPQGLSVFVDGVRVNVSNLDKVFYPRTGFTKGKVTGKFPAFSSTANQLFGIRPVVLVP